MTYDTLSDVLAETNQAGEPIPRWKALRLWTAVDHDPLLDVGRSAMSIDPDHPGVVP